jgi:hypothetical protein
MLKNFIATVMIAVSALAGLGRAAGTASTDGGTCHPGDRYLYQTNLVQAQCEQDASRKFCAQT